MELDRDLLKGLKREINSKRDFYFLEGWIQTVHKNSLWALQETSEVNVDLVYYTGCIMGYLKNRRGEDDGSAGTISWHVYSLLLPSFVRLCLKYEEVNMCRRDKQDPGNAMHKAMKILLYQLKDDVAAAGLALPKPPRLPLLPLNRNPETGEWYYDEGECATCNLPIRPRTAVMP